MELAGDNTSCSLMTFGRRAGETPIQKRRCRGDGGKKNTEDEMLFHDEKESENERSSSEGVLAS